MRYHRITLTLRVSSLLFLVCTCAAVSASELPGDLDSDGDVDLSDFVYQLSRWTGEGGIGRGPLDGDMDGDGDVDRDDQNIAKLLLTPGPEINVPSSGQLSFEDTVRPNLIYDPASGRAWLDPDGHQITGFAISSPFERFLFHDDFDLERAALPFVGIGARTFAESDCGRGNCGRQFGIASTQSDTIDELFHLGYLFPESLTQEMLAERLTSAHYSGFGTGGDMDILICPDYECVSLVGERYNDTAAADFIYNPFTGNVSLSGTDTATEAIISFVLQSRRNSFDVDQLQLPFPNVGTNTDKVSFQIAQTDPLRQGTEFIDLGSILPAELSADDILAHLSNRSYSNTLGNGGQMDLLICLDLECTDTHDLSPGTGGGLGTRIEFGGGDENWLPTEGGAGNTTDGRNADLVYNPFDGSIAIDPTDTSERILSYSISSTQLMRPDNLRYPFVVAAGLADILVSEIIQNDPLNYGIAKAWQLGTILQPGFESPDSLKDSLARAEYRTDEGLSEFDLRVCLDADCTATSPADDKFAPTPELDVLRRGKLEDGDDANLIYNPSNGNVTLVASTGDVITGFILGSNELTSLVPDNLDLPFDETSYGTSVAQPFQISQSDFDRVGKEQFDLGQILPPGLDSPREIFDHLSVAQYFGLESSGNLDILICDSEDCSTARDGAVDGNAGDGVTEDRPGFVDLSYDPQTGSVTLDATDTAGGMIFGFELETTDPVLRASEFETPFDDVLESTTNTSRIAQSSAAGVGPVVNLGTIFPTNLDDAELSSFLRRARFESQEWTGQLDLVEAACGDFDEDGDVDSADRTIQTLGWTGALEPEEEPLEFVAGDCDFDGDVDTADQATLIRNWSGGQFVELNATNNGAIMTSHLHHLRSIRIVPEPTGQFLAIVSVFMALLFARRPLRQ